jgi:Tol biopolymer transport system component
MGRFGWLLIAGVLYLVSVMPVRAQEVCGFTQITNTTGNNSVSSTPAFNTADNRIVFASTADLVGSNSDGGFEIFLWDASMGLTQITNLNSPSNPIPTVNADGSRIAFQSDADPLGTNADKNFEIFLWDASTGLTQITNTSSGSSSTPTITAAGNRIVFQSYSDLAGSNSDGNLEIFLWDSSTGFTQITNTSGGHSSFAPVINASGNRIAFASDGDPLGSNGDGNFEIFLWDAATGLTQITNTIGGSSFASGINAAGNRIAFQSIADLVGTNSEGNNEIFLWDSSTGFTQITDTVNADSSTVSINAAGDRLAFQSNGNLLGSNSDNSVEVFLWDAASGLTQVTHGTLGSFFPKIDASGHRIAFTSRDNLAGGNSDGNAELFLAFCPVSVAEAPAASPLGLGVLATLLGLAATWTLRRRRGHP